MYIRLCVLGGIISGDKVRDLCDIFGINLFNSFEQRKQYDEYYYKWEDNPYVFVYEFERVKLGEVK